MNAPTADLAEFDCSTTPPGARAGWPAALEAVFGMMLATPVAMCSGRAGATTARSLVADAWPALVDASQLENALLNLCINARDAMPDGGAITVETANKWIDERVARQQNMAQGQYLALSVGDTAVGMAPNGVARAFEPFFTTKPIGQGTGLGLSMFYGVAQQSGGQARI